MKHSLRAIGTILVFSAFCACSKSNGSGAGSPISTDADAKAAFVKINSLYYSVLTPLLTKKKQKFDNFVLYDSAGQKMIANGEYSTSSFSGSSGGTSSSTVDVVISFQGYNSGGLQLNGNLHFFDWYSSRTDCSSSGCATSTHKNLKYATVDTTAANAVAIRFDNNGHTISDNITLSSSKEFSKFSVILKNARREKFTFYY